jgi:ParB-like chromosome segregation protein Spo0J
MGEGETVTRTAKPQLTDVPIAKCVALRRNPQFVSPHAMEAMKASMTRDGFLAPVLLRPMGDDFEVVSGNHRVMAARELGMSTVPALIMDLSDTQVGRIAVNMNTVHGDPTAELLAPFLAELDDEALSTVHMGDDLLKDVLALDDELAARLSELQTPDNWDNESPKGAVPDCVCPNCGRRHVKAKTED